MDWDWIKYKIINECTYNKKYLKKNFLKKESYVVDIKEYAGKKVLNIEDTNAFIFNMIKGDHPFAVCRFGATEMRTIHSYLQLKHFPHKDTRKKCIDQLCQLSGFFPNDISKGEKFVDLMLEDCQMIDLFAIWNLYMEDYIIDKYAASACLSHLGSLEPWNLDSFSTKPWTSALKGKRVLVIHPFAETIDKQYHNYRTKIFEKKFKCDDILPEFDLITLKAIQTINFNSESQKYKDWFEALNFMVKQCEKIDFDVAIIGCGAYGLPLATAIKQMGKGAIHLGGATQLLFGIMGKRWEVEGYKEIFDQIKNEYWTRPLPEEKPQNADQIENGCYW